MSTPYCACHCCGSIDLLMIGHLHKAKTSGWPALMYKLLRYMLLPNEGTSTSDRCDDCVICMLCTAMSTGLCLRAIVVRRSLSGILTWPVFRLD